MSSSRAVLARVPKTLSFSRAVLEAVPKKKIMALSYGNFSFLKSVRPKPERKCYADLKLTGPQIEYLAKVIKQNVQKLSD